jgi:hypothetical protein
MCFYVQLCELYWVVPSRLERETILWARNAISLIEARLNEMIEDP